MNRDDLGQAGKTRKDGTTGELDWIAYHGNCVWLIEHTISPNIGSYDFDNFLAKIRKLDEDRNLLAQCFKIIQQTRQFDIPGDNRKLRVFGLYVAPRVTEATAKTLMHRKTSADKVKVWDRDTFEYFKVVAGTIRTFSRYELFGYFDITPNDVFPKHELRQETSNTTRKVVEIGEEFGARTYTFKEIPYNLLRTCYVLRNEGWRSDSFQRIINPNKLANIRSYMLRTERPGFVNNIIISPAPNVKINPPKDGVDEISLPNNFNSFCVIDGQHRLLAFTQDYYSETNPVEKQNDEKIKNYAKNADIIVTLIVPEGDAAKILKKQIELFIDINSNQTKVKAEFIFNLKEITAPLDNEALSNKVIRALNAMEDGALTNMFAIKSLPSYSGLIRRTSIVQAGLFELVNIGADKRYLGKLYGKPITKANSDKYIQWCAKQLNNYFSCIQAIYKEKYGANAWGNSKNTGYVLLTSSSIVGFLRLYRHFIISNIKEKDKIKQYLKCIKVNFKEKAYKHHSSHWAELEKKMYDDIAHKYASFGDPTLIKRGKPAT